ncbi:uncharacterized protein LOC126735596 [Anthonomus grandis grandis]|uniref:uncharacterized protein LOC126735596 n=1 Tax=Anthonomus grandis grandis TaxID=2921223 RepID=UPI002165C0A4|nr:uncharacterized protein LOC126735596 [Anthonomus grandis grandis]
MIECFHDMHYDQFGNITMGLKNFVWALLICIDMHMIFVMGTKAEREAEDTLKILNMVRCDQKKEFQIQKDLFLLQAQNHGLSLKACGFLTFNNKTCLNIVGIALTYFILMQGL